MRIARMSIVNGGVKASNNQVASSSALKDAQREQKAAADEQPNPMADQIVDKLISSPEFTKKALSKLGNGQELTITVNGEDVIKIKNEGPGVAEKFIKGAQYTLTAVTEEAARVVEADPAFAFKEAAMGVRTQVADGIPDQAASLIDTAFLPMLRIVALGLDGKKAIDTYRNKDASTLDKIVDGVHVLTDVAGVIGALGYDMVPALNGLAGPLTAVGLAGDVASYSYHVLQYLRERGQLNVNQKKDEPPKQPDIAKQAGGEAQPLTGREVA